MRQDVLDIEEDIQAKLFGQLDHAKQDRGRAPAFVTAKKKILRPTTILHTPYYQSSGICHGLSGKSGFIDPAGTERGGSQLL